jgi:ubiquinone biosynthesis protein
VKVFITLEGLGRRLDPGFDMVGAATPFVQRVQRERLAPRALAHRLHHALAEAVETLGALPRQLRRLLAATSGGRMRLHVDVEDLRDFGAQVGRSANRLSISLVISALIIGSSIVMTVDGGPRLLGLPLFGFAGFVAAVAGGAWLLFSVLRSGGGR